MEALNMISNLHTVFKLFRLREEALSAVYLKQAIHSSFLDC